MSDVENDLRGRVDHFVNELSALIRRQALEAVEEVIKQGGMGITAPAQATKKLGRPAKAAPAPAHVPTAKAAPAAKGPAKAAPAAAKRKAGEKRAPAELAAITEQVYNYIKSNPNQGVEQIAKALQTSTKELTLPIRKLLTDKRVTSKGQKRATRYSPKS